MEEVGGFQQFESTTAQAESEYREAVAAAESSPCVVAVGVNCTDPQHVEELVARMRAVTALAIVVYPNAGGVWNASTGVWQEPLDDLPLRRLGIEGPIGR